jgi:hypothetical protein
VSTPGPDDWTDEEWLWLLAELPPTATAEEAGRRVRARRARTEMLRRRREAEEAPGVS